jgi:hypothetical protein
MTGIEAFQEAIATVFVNFMVFVAKSLKLKA